MSVLIFFIDKDVSGGMGTYSLDVSAFVHGMAVVDIHIVGKVTVDLDDYFLC